MGMHQQRWDIAKIRRRHKAYRNLLLLELVMIWLIPFSQRFPLIIDLGAVALEVFFLNLVVHLSVLRSGRRLVYSLGGCSLLVELLWIMSRHGSAAAAMAAPWIGSLALLRFVLFVLFFGLVQVRLVRSLIREPFVTTSVLMGAAAGYVLIGLLGGVLLNTLFLLHPVAFGGLPSPPDATLTMASLELLTTVGSGALVSSNLAAQAAAFTITLTGQMYVAILIALVLGRFHRRVPH